MLDAPETARGNGAFLGSGRDLCWGFRVEGEAGGCGERPEEALEVSRELGCHYEDRDKDY